MPQGLEKDLYEQDNERRELAARARASWSELDYCVRRLRELNCMVHMIAKDQSNIEIPGSEISIEFRQKL